MAIKVAWDSPEHRTVLYVFDADWTWDELIEAAQADDPLIESVDHTVHIILDGRQARKMPGNITGRMHEFSPLIHPRLGLIILVGADMWAEIILSLFYRKYGQNLVGLKGVRCVLTLDDARALLAAYPPD
jgi:hypothetical protein